MFAIIAERLAIPLYIKRTKKNKGMFKVDKDKMPILTNNEDDVYLTESIGLAITIAKFMTKQTDGKFDFKVTRMTYHKMKALSNGEGDIS